LYFARPKLPFFPVLNIVGGILILSGILFHVYAGNNHKQAHEKSADMVKIVNDGDFSKLWRSEYRDTVEMIRWYR